MKVSNLLYRSGKEEMWNRTGTEFRENKERRGYPGRIIQFAGEISKIEYGK